jgi:hypothetical protein
MSRAKTSHRVRRAKNARTGNQILLRKIDAAFGRAAVRVACERIELLPQKLRAAKLVSRDFVQGMQKMAQGAALVAQGIRNAWGV